LWDEALPVEVRELPDDLAALDRLLADPEYCAHWPAREQQLTGHLNPWPDQLVPGAIQQRRHSFEWLFAERDLDWEEVDLST
jgi:hypothetical protein